MKTLTINEQEKQILNTALSVALHAGILSDNDKETAEILLFAINRI